MIAPDFRTSEAIDLASAIKAECAGRFRKLSNRWMHQFRPVNLAAHAK